MRMNNSALHSMYFLAVLCPPAIDEKVQAHKLWMRDRFGCTVALKSAAHITLIPPFWLQNESEDALINTLHSFQTIIPSFENQLQGFSHFSNRVIFVAVNQNHQLGSLRKAAEDHFIIPFHGIIKPDDRPFHPHITIANRDVKPNDFKKAWAYFEKKEFRQTFSASAISLLKLSPGKWNMIAEKVFH